MAAPDTARRTSALTLCAAAILLVFTLAPLSVALTVSLQPDEQQILRDFGSWRSFVPAAFSAANYLDVWTDPDHPFGRYLFNTAFIATAMLVLSIPVNSMAAFVVAQGDIAGRKVLVGLIMASLAIPGESLVLPQLFLASRTGLIDSYAVQIVPGIANALSIFLFYQFFSRLPRDVVDAARLDGLTFFQIYRFVAMPLSRPVIVTISVLQFLEIWNSYLWPVMVTRGPDVRPLAVGLSAYFGTHQADWGNVMAFAVSMAVPVVILFAVLQREINAGMAGASLKG